MFDLSWSFMNPIIKKQKKSILQVSDFNQKKYDVETKKLGALFVKAYNTNPDKSVFRHILYIMRKHITIMLCTIPFFTLSAAMGPICIQYFQTFLQPQNIFNCGFSGAEIAFEQMTTMQGFRYIFSNLYGYLILTIISQIFRTLCESACNLQCSQMAVKSNSMLLDVLYNKMTRLSETVKTINAQGSLANILFTDTFSIQIFFRYSYQVFQMPMELVAGAFLLAFYVHPVALVSILVILIFIGGVFLLANIMQTFINRLAPLRDQRSQNIQEVLNAIKVVKLFGIEDFQKQKIQNVRTNELENIVKALQILSAYMTLGFTNNTITSLIAFGAMIGFGVLDLRKSFTIMYLFTFMQYSVGILPPLMTLGQDAIISIKRIQAFFKLPEIDQSFVQQQKDFENAISISGGHSFAYGLEDDHKVKPELDPSFFIKMDKMKALKKAVKNVDNQIQKVDLEEELEIKLLFQQNKYQLLDDICPKLCFELKLPAVSYFLSIKNYNPSYFQIHKGDSASIQAKKLYLHKCVMNYLFTEVLECKPKQIKPVICDLELVIPKGQLVGIKGNVGSGKSSLFSCILGEMKVTDVKQDQSQNQKLIFDYYGDEYKEEKDPSKIFIKIGGKVAFCPQNSPIFSSTIRENICFYHPYEEEKYNRIVDICCLLPDFDIFTARDQTEVGGRGVTLSGGQRARIALARAIYNDADIYLLDDPLSAVDAHVGARIWNEVIRNYLIAQGKTVLIASHQVHYFKDCNRILTIDNGKIVKDHVQKPDESSFSTNLETSSAAMKTKIDSVNQIAEINQQDVAAKNKPQTSDGKLSKKEDVQQGNVSCKTYSTFVKSGNKCLLFLFILFLIIYMGFSQYFTVIVSHWASDQYGWTKDEGLISVPTELLSTINKAQQKYGAASFITQGVINCAARLNGQEITRPAYSMRYFYLFIGLVVGVVICYFSFCVLFTRFATSATKAIYMKTLKSLISSKLSFFDTTPQGRIINRLVKDCEAIDYMFVRFIIFSLSGVSSLFGMIITIIAVTWPTVIIVVPCLIIFLVLFKTFRKITPSIRRIESITRSNVFNVCQETLDQLTTIRAYNVQDQFRNQFRNYAHENIQMQWHAMGMTRWVWFRFTIVGAFMSFLIALASMIATPLSLEIAQYSGIIVSYGFAMQQVIMIAVDSIINMEGEMPAIERMVEYQHLENEDELNNRLIQQNSYEQKQNNQGLTISNLVMRYRPELPCALKGVDIHIEKGEHVAVVGRTGSGKSSLAITLFKLYQPEGNYLIQLDDEVLSKMPLYEARRKLAIIPQEPFLFSGSLRQQFCEYTRNKAEGLPIDGLQRIPDDKLWQLLEVVQLADYIRNQPGQLDCQVLGNGENFSSGQRQLVCVVRALLRDVQIVLLDEATAYVDQKTDHIIQNIVKTQLRDKIVISIAHRLDTVLGMDKVLVMDQGVVAEFGTKEELYQKQNGIFRELAIKAGIIIE